MQIRQLEYFVALAEEGHFSRAAAVCYVSQPSLSDAVHRLEEELGVRLVRRRRTYEGLTPEGERVLVWARKILSDYRGLKQDARSFGSALRGSLTLGSIPAGSGVGASLLDALCLEHPGIRARLVSSLRTAEVLDAVAGFRLDAGLVYLGEPLPEGLAVLPLYQEEQVLIVHRDRLPEDGASGARQALEELPLCLLSREMKGRELVRTTLNALGLPDDPRIETDSLAALISLVSSGRWASIVSRQWLHGIALPAEIGELPLATPAEGKVGLVHAVQEPQEPVLRALIATARTVAADRLP